MFYLLLGYQVNSRRMVAESKLIVFNKLCFRFLNGDCKPNVSIAFMHCFHLQDQVSKQIFRFLPVFCLACFSISSAHFMFFTPCRALMNRNKFQSESAGNSWTSNRAYWAKLNIRVGQLVHTNTSDIKE